MFLENSAYHVVNKYLIAINNFVFLTIKVIITLFLSKAVEQKIFVFKINFKALKIMLSFMHVYVYFSLVNNMFGTISNNIIETFFNLNIFW